MGISGGSGIPLATELLSRLQKIEEIETHLVYTRGAEITAAQESELSMGEICALADVVYDNKDIGAAKLQKEYMTQSGSLRMEKAVRRTFLCPAVAENFARQDVFCLHCRRVWYTIKNGQENGLQKSSWKGGI